MDESPRRSVTRVGFGLALVFVLGLAATFLSSSHVIQLVGFVMLLGVVTVLLIEFRPRRARNRPQPLRERTGYVPSARVIDPTWNDGDTAIRREDAERERERRPGRGA
jgi:membrane protein implicated in regulation of membrane protease activity